jgi:O-antigen ligase
MAMEEKSKSNSLIFWNAVSAIKTSTFWILFFSACYVAVLPMANTIALRNVFLLLLVLCLVGPILKIRPSFKCPWPVFLWGLYLCIFPFISDSSDVAVTSLFGQWGRGLVAMLVGASVATVLCKENKGTVFYLGVASAVPILIHLSLFAWKVWETSSIPWGYWGRETHHADLGYAAGQSVILLATAIVAGNRVWRLWGVALIVACLMSTALAHSRAGLAFCLVGGLLVFSAVYLLASLQRRTNFLVIFASLVLAGAAVLVFAVKDDVRWQSMASQLVAGFQGDAIQIQCEGTSSIESKIIAQYGSGEQAQRVIAGVRDGDGARMVLLRAGFELALKHPWGSDGSRQAFQKLLREECSNPVISMAHTHNGWLDTLLALGWGGVALYMTMLVYFFQRGSSQLRSERTANVWALVLAALSVFWIFRGFTDSVFRDHMLEMQGFVLAYASVALAYKKSMPK